MLLWNNCLIESWECVFTVLHQASPDAGPSQDDAACAQFSVSGCLWPVLATGHQPLPSDVRGTAATPASLQHNCCSGFHFVCRPLAINLCVCALNNKCFSRELLANHSLLLTDRGISPWAGNCHGNRLQGADLQQGTVMKEREKLNQLSEIPKDV